MNVNEQFEKNAAAFYRDTGIWPLGKDRAAAAGPIDEQEVRRLARIHWEKHRWILIEERLPEKNKACLVFNGGVVMIYMWFGKELRWGGPCSITHWKPIILPD